MVDSQFQLLILSLRIELQDKKLRTMFDFRPQGARDNSVAKKVGKITKKPRLAA